jgi:hypothetical protein
LPRTVEASDRIPSAATIRMVSTAVSRKDPRPSSTARSPRCAQRAADR